MPSRLKVLHVMTAIDRGGAENHLMDLVTHQCTTGMDVTVAHLKGKGYWVPRMEALGAKTHFLDLKYYGDRGPVGRLRRIVKEGNFDLVHAHLPPAELYVRVALLGTAPEQVPLLISKHNDCAFHDRLPGEKLLGRWVARRAWKVVAISDAVRRFMVEPTLGLPEPQVETIYYGSDPVPYEGVSASAIAAHRQSWGVVEGEHMVIGFMGRLVPQKDIHTLLRAFALFKKAHPGAAKLVLVGMGPLEMELKQCARELGLGEDEIFWPGFREDVPVLMNAFDVFALTSVHEGFGLVLVEAMAASKPVVATRSGAIPEVVADRETGYLTAAGDAPALCAAFAELLDPARRTRLGTAGRERVKAKFTLARMFAETDRLYERCLAHYGKRPAAAAAPRALAAS